MLLMPPHIVADDASVPMIAGTRIKVIEVVLDHLAYRWDAQEIHRQHPHLSLGQIHSALAYYYDHEAEMDKAIAASLASEDEILNSLGPSPLRLKLQALKKRT
jgi:uncharacterized protein (DUF433 family)